MSTRAEPISRAALVDASLGIIAAGQDQGGAYLAASGYATYDYCWLRDGAFIAAAMDAYAHSASAAAFHGWVARTMGRYETRVEALERALGGPGDAEDPLRLLDPRLTLHTRFTAQGAEGDEPWGDFQLDGYGFWLASLAAHLAQSAGSAAPFLAGIQLVRRYLELVWEHPCFDSWEEYPGRRHVTTWAAIAAGLRATDGLVGGPASDVPDRIVARLRDIAGAERVLPKFVPGRALVERPTDDDGSHAVAGHERAGRPLAADAIDGSSLLVLGPFGPFDDGDPLVAATLAAVEKTLVVEGGVHRYLDDEYYGGGLWVVLAGALAQVQAVRDPSRADEVLRWVEAQADEQGRLPEQVEIYLRQPTSRAAWVERWGPPARPLLWSHAMYLLGLDALRAGAS